MKPALIAIALFLISGQLSFGQANSFTVGITAGPGLTSMHGNPMLDDLHRPTIGYTAGISGQYFFTHRFSVASQVSYERKGSVAVLRSVIIDNGVIDKLKVYGFYNYLTVPLLARLTFGNQISYFINGGPYFGYLLSQQNRSSPDLGLSGQINLFKRFDAGLSTGFGMVVPAGDRRFVSFEIRNNLGLVNISDAPVANNGSIQTNSLNFLLGLSVTPGAK